ncbi:replication initiation factor domain-containing protein [Vagococcus fluvialis]|uniref:replication initiation factor domain-containing protein n=3 Tax=Vagococcus fluvialis TaxID=2738 RepID=UPI0032E485C6
MYGTDLKSSNPPYSSTGGTHTDLSKMNACVDWFSCTFKDLQNWENVRDILRLENHYFEDLPSGKNGYKSGVKSGSIKIYYNGNSDMGVYLEMSGQACREYEYYFKEDLNWLTLFALCLNFNINIPRLDIALDDFQERLDFNKMLKKITKGHITSKFKKARDYREYLLTDGSKVGETLYFGTGDVIFRFYDKLSERLNKGYTLKLDVELDSWQRYEMQLRNERALRAVELIVEDEVDLGIFCLGVFKEYISFRDKHKTDTNKSRWNISKFWLDFLKDVEKVKLTHVAPEQSIIRTKNWIGKQVVSSMIMLKKALKDDDLLNEYIDVLGQSKINDEKSNLALEFSDDNVRLLQLRADMREEINSIKKLSNEPEEFNQY